MPLYRVFGDILDTSLAFPELQRATPGAVPHPGWRLSVAEADIPVDGLEALGTDELTAGVTATLYRAPGGGCVLRFDDTGTFQVSSAGDRILWRPIRVDQLELGRVDFLGRVLAVAAHARGQLCLHGSAVVLPSGAALGFLAPKGFGKSTMALELLGHGARLLTDDTLPVVPETGLADPGVHSVRLRDDVLGRFAALGRPRRSLSDKLIVEDLAGSLLTHRRAQLAALYALTPVEPGRPLTREVLPQPLAALTLIQYAKLGSLLGGSAAPEVLDRAAKVAARVPVYRLLVPRELERLPEVAGQLVTWTVDDLAAAAAAG